MSAVGQALGKIVVDPSARVRRIEDEYLRPLPPLWSRRVLPMQCWASAVRGHGSGEYRPSLTNLGRRAGESGVARTLPTAAMTTGAARLDELR